jgi:hypothetical protein
MTERRITQISDLPKDYLSRYTKWICFEPDYIKSRKVNDKQYIRGSAAHVIVDGKVQLLETKTMSPGLYLVESKGTQVIQTLEHPDQSPDETSNQYVEYLAKCVILLRLESGSHFAFFCK